MKEWKILLLLIKIRGRKSGEGRGRRELDRGKRGRRGGEWNEGNEGKMEEGGGKEWKGRIVTGLKGKSQM